MNSVSKITEVTRDEIHYDNGMVMKVHESGVLHVLFNTRERWCDKAQVYGVDPEMKYFGFWFSSDEGYDEDVILEWPEHLGNIADFRSLAEQNKDQVELFFFPWDMFK